MTFHRLAAGSAAAILALAAMPAFADSFDSEGTGTGQSVVTPHAIAEGHMVIGLDTTYARYEMADSANPMNGMSGPCSGTIEVRPGGIARGGGFCAFSDGDGDRAVVRWQSERLTPDGRNTGTWSLRGGTGKWDGASGGGLFSAKTDRETGAHVNTLSGAISMP